MTGHQTAPTREQLAQALRDLLMDYEARVEGADSARNAQKILDSMEEACYCGGWTSAEGERFHNTGCPEAEQPS